MQIKRQPGFTIVELLIVIVVIAILAAISIVAYRGIQERARASQASSALVQSKKKLELYKVDATTYPTTGNLASAGVIDSDVSYQYSSDGTTYCLTATVGVTSYKATNTSAPEQGGCAGHGQGGVAAITNWADNPSSESSVLVLNTGGSSTATRVSTEAHDGTYSTRLIKTGGFTYARSVSSNISVAAGDVITTCAWVKSSVSSIRMARRGVGIPYSTTGLRPVTPNVWTNVCDTYTIPIGGTGFLDDIGWESADVADGATVYIDGIMITKGSTQYSFADGSSPNWVWNGTAHNSTSTGPPL